MPDLPQDLTVANPTPNGFELDYNIAVNTITARVNVLQIDIGVSPQFSNYTLHDNVKLLDVQSNYDLLQGVQILFWHITYNLFDDAGNVDYAFYIGINNLIGNMPVVPVLDNSENPANLDTETDDDTNARRWFLLDEFDYI